jgi:hypothetical protein
MGNQSGCFLRLEFGEEGLPAHLRKDAPEVLWVPAHALNDVGADARAETLVAGHLLGSPETDAGRTLVARSQSGRLCPNGAPAG